MCISRPTIAVLAQQLWAVALAATFACAGLESRAETVVAPDQRLPTLHCLSASVVHGTPAAQCELVNDTSVRFLFDGSTKTSPNYSVEQRRSGLWSPVHAAHDSTPLKRHSITVGTTVKFSAVLPKPPEPARLKLIVYRSGETSPISVTSNAVRLPGRIDVGQDDDIPMILCVDVAPPKVIHRVEPTYPKIAQLARIQGTVVLDVVIDRDGNVTDAVVVRSVPVLDPAAIGALKEWKYEPARDRRGHAVPVYFSVSVKFELPPAATTSAIDDGRSTPLGGSK